MAQRVSKLPSAAVTPQLGASSGQQAEAPAGSSAPATATSVVGARVLKPPPKKAQPGPASATAPKAEKPSGAGKKVYIVAEENDPLRIQLGDFLSEIGLEEVEVKRTHGQMLDLDAFQHRDDVTYAFFIFNNEDLSYAMFELGHFVGKLGKGRVSVLHMSDVNFPKNVPGVLAKPIVVKLEESSLAIMKELKAAGYTMSF